MKKMGEKQMKRMTLKEACAYLESATILESIDHGHTITHFGTNADGVWFVMENDCLGKTYIYETM